MAVLAGIYIYIYIYIYTVISVSDYFSLVHSTANNQNKYFMFLTDVS